MAADVSPADGQGSHGTVIRPKVDGDSLLLTIFLGGIGLAAIVGAITMGTGHGHGNGVGVRVGLAAFGPVVASIPFLAIWQYRLVVTADALVYRRVGRRPKAAVNRGEIATVRWQRKGRGFIGRFEDSDGNALVELEPWFTHEQVKRIAAVLGKPLLKSA